MRVDEAGRGPCAGPLCVAAVILDPACLPDGIDDSKALTEARRFALEPQIKAAAMAWSVITVTVEEIDTLNILGATMAGMARAVEALDPCAHHALIDYSNRCPKLTIPSTADHQGGRPVAVDRRRLDPGQDSARPYHDRDGRPLSGLRLPKGYKGYQAEAHLDALRRARPLTDPPPVLGHHPRADSGGIAQHFPSRNIRTSSPPNALAFGKRDRAPRLMARARRRLSRKKRTKRIQKW